MVLDWRMELRVSTTKQMETIFAGGAVAMSIKREFDMREPVCNWLLIQDFCPAVEFRLCNHSCDIVGSRYGERPAARRIPPLLELWSVELKMDDVAGVIRQAKKNARRSNRSWCAFPDFRIAKMRDSTIDRFENEGLGLLSVGSKVEVIIPAVSGERILFDNHIRQLWRRVKAHYVDQT